MRRPRPPYRYESLEDDDRFAASLRSQGPSLRDIAFRAANNQTGQYNVSASSREDAYAMRPISSGAFVRLANRGTTETFLAQDASPSVETGVESAARSLWNSNPDPFLSALGASDGAGTITLGRPPLQSRFELLRPLPPREMAQQSSRPTSRHGRSQHSSQRGAPWGTPASLQTQWRNSFNHSPIHYGVVRRLSAPGIPMPRPPTSQTPHQRGFSGWPGTTPMNTSNTDTDLYWQMPSSEFGVLETMVQQTLAMDGEDVTTSDHYSELRNLESLSPTIVTRPSEPRERYHPRRLGALARMRLDRERDGYSAAVLPSDCTPTTRSRSCDRTEPSLSLSDEGRRLTPCAFLQPGTSFEGSQSFLAAGSQPFKAWNVTVEITQVSLSNGSLSGTMTADNIPSFDGGAKTFWRGEVIDMAHNTFASPHHGIDEETDCEQWRKFDAFHVLGAKWPWQLRQLTLDRVDASGYIFMRWKERTFLSRSTGGSFGSLTIAGFYYVCLERRTGEIHGIYYDGRHTMPMQKLQLKPSGPESGFSFGQVGFS